MVAEPMQTVTVDRISNSGNAIAQEQFAGKSIHVPAGEVGMEYDVRLIDEGGYFVAQLVDRTAEIQPRQPGIGPDTSDVGKDLLDPGRNSPHSFEIRSSAGGLRSSGDNELRRRVSRRKM